MQISIEELLKKNNVHIIDIRNKKKYFNNHIPGSISIDEFELLIHTDRYLNKNEVYYIYCDFGNRSERVVSTLNKAGYHTVNIIGGYKNYLFQK